MVTMEQLRYRLEVIRRIDSSIKLLYDRRRELMAAALATNPSAHDDPVRTSGSKRRTADLIDRYVDAGAALDALIDEYVDNKADIEHMIRLLPNQVEQCVLRMRYIDLCSPGEVAEGLGRAYTWATSVQHRALRHLLDILNEEE